MKMTSREKYQKWRLAHGGTQNGTPEWYPKTTSVAKILKNAFSPIYPRILEIWRWPPGKKCEEFFSGQNGIEISAEISTGAEISTKIGFS